MNNVVAAFRTAAACAVATLVAVLAPSWAQAAGTCLVSNVADSGAGSLRQALTDLRASGGASCSVINITATGTIAVASPLPVIATSLAITGPGRGVLTIDGGRRRPLLQVAARHGLTLSLTGLSLARGKAADCAGCASPGDPDGGALVVTARGRGKVTLTDMAFTGNRTSGSGGAVRVRGVPLVVVNSTFTGNTAFDAGGAIDAQSVAVRGSTFTRNSTGLLQGGAINTQALSVVGSIFDRNASADNGGAIDFSSTFGGGIVLSTFTGNTSHEMHGGALSMYLDPGTRAVIQDCSFSGNSGADGGAVFAPREFAVDEPRSASLLIGRSTFADNLGLDGGAVYAEGLASVLVSNSTFTRNSAEKGGALMFVDTDSTVQFSTIAANEATGAGGGIWANRFSFTLSNSVLWANRAPVGADLNDTAKRSTLSAGLFSSRSTVVSRRGLTSATGLIYDTNPLLGPLANNSGPTSTMMPGARSPLIDAGIAKVPAPPVTDQRGEPRTIAGASDIGSVEVSSVVHEGVLAP